MCLLILGILLELPKEIITGNEIYYDSPNLHAKLIRKNIYTRDKRPWKLQLEICEPDTVEALDMVPYAPILHIIFPRK